MYTSDDLGLAVGLLAVALVGATLVQTLAVAALKAFMRAEHLPL